MFNKKTVEDVDLTGKRVIVRAMLNVPIKDNKVVDDIRLQSAKPTIKYLIDNGASVVLISHHSDEKQTLAPVAPALSEILSLPVKFVSESIGENVATALGQLQPGEILMLENLRFHPEEKANDQQFAKTLASYGDIFVNDDFTTSHREHASMVGIAKFIPAVAGLSIENEVKTISAVIENPKRPLVAVVGGAKISTKIPILSFLIDKVDAVLVVGAMANTFLLALGKKTGKSLVEQDQVELASKTLENAKSQGKKILLPLDVVVAKQLDPPENIRTISVDEIEDDDIIADLGPTSINQLDQVITPDGSVIWNGPAGIFETSEFAGGTKILADKIINSRAYSLVGGGDTLSFIDQEHLQDEFGFVSTGGGASMDLLSGKNLIGIEALEDK